MRQHKKSDMRRQIAHRAARLLGKQECLDFQEARQKAASQLGNRDTRQLPEMFEIEQALREYQTIFLSDTQPAALRYLRGLAFNAMQNLQQFQPHLTGPILDGSADKLSPIRLFLYVDSPEEVILFLLERQIPFEEGEIRLSFSCGIRKILPQFRFSAGDGNIELTVLPIADRANPPLDPLTDRPYKGANLSRVATLLGK